MDTGLQTLEALASLLIFLAVIPALWVSGRIVRRNPDLGQPFSRLFVWFVLGGLFLIPLVDLISYLRDAISLAFPAGQNLTEFPLFLGATSWPTYSTLATAFALIVYAVGAYYGLGIVSKHAPAYVRAPGLRPWERGFLVLGIAGLFAHMINGIVINFLWIRIPPARSGPPQGSIAAFAGWVIALLLLALAGIAMQARLDREQASRRRPSRR